MVSNARVEAIAYGECQYPVSISARDFGDEASPRDGGTLTVFDMDAAIAINDRPIAALRRFESTGCRLLILEMVCDSSRPLCILADETRAASQALEGVGGRPSPSFLTLALNRVGFAYVYAAAKPPAHPDFQFEWRNNLDTSRDGTPLRCVFVASRTRLDQQSLVPLLES
jgi:hypothetical protein